MATRTLVLFVKSFVSSVVKNQSRGTRKPQSLHKEKLVQILFCVDFTQLTFETAS
jgi:hypothetical protein